MRAIYKDALICDFAQYYHLYDLDQIGLKTASILACGLPPDSRTIKKIAGQKYSTEMLLQMGVLDALRSLEHAYISVHSKKKIPKPQSIFKLLSQKDDKEIRTFRSGEDFERERIRLLRGAING